MHAGLKLPPELEELTMTRTRMRPDPEPESTEVRHVSKRVIYTRTPPWWLPQMFCWCLFRHEFGVILCGMALIVLTVSGIILHVDHKVCMLKDTLIVSAVLIGFMFMEACFLFVSSFSETPKTLFQIFSINFIVMLMSFSQTSVVIFQLVNVEGVQDLYRKLDCLTCPKDQKLLKCVIHNLGIQLPWFMVVTVLSVIISINSYSFRWCMMHMKNLEGVQNELRSSFYKKRRVNKLEDM